MKGIFLFPFLLVAAAPALGQQQIGSTHSVVPDATGTVTGTLVPGSVVHERETIGTGKAGKAGLKFNDNTNLDVGPSSSVRLDKFVYDPHRGKGEVILNAAKGSFRFTVGTGAQGVKQTIKTPYGTLGVRG